MAERTYPQGKKSISDSLTESIKSVRYEDINGVNRLFGGRLMEWIDETAGIAARRHCGGDVTTACVDQLTFKHPAFLNDVVVIVAAVTYVGHTSIPGSAVLSTLPTSPRSAWTRRASPHPSSTASRSRQTRSAASTRMPSSASSFARPVQRRGSSHHAAGG